MDIKGKQKLVLDVIRANPGVQNNDADLIAAVWRHEGWTDGRSLEENILTVTRSETITRRRRELHEMGLITYSAEALIIRQAAFESEQNQHSEYAAISWLND